MRGGRERWCRLLSRAPVVRWEFLDRKFECGEAPDIYSYLDIQPSAPDNLLMLKGSLISVLSVLLCLHILLHAEDNAPDPELVRTIVSTEFKYLRLPSGSTFCLAMPPNGSNSPTARDPSPEMLALLSRFGFKVQGLSVCNRESSGKVMLIDRTQYERDLATVEVDLANYTVPRGQCFASGIHSREYVLKRNSKGEWRVRSWKALLKP